MCSDIQIMYHFLFSHLMPSCVGCTFRLINVTMAADDPDLRVILTYHIVTNSPLFGLCVA